MKVNIPAVKRIPGIPNNLSEMLEKMTDEQLIDLAGFEGAQAELVANWTDEQLQSIVDGTPEGKKLEAQLDALE